MTSLLNIFVTRCRSHMGFPPMNLESKLLHFLFALNDFLVTFTFDFLPFLYGTACLNGFGSILAKIIMKGCIPIKLESRTICIGCNGYVPDEYLPNVIK